MSFDAFLNTSLAKYQYPGKTKDEVTEVMTVFGDLRPKLEETRTEDDERKFLLLLHGTIPVHYLGMDYNTPIEMWISDKHPYQAPVVSVKPTSSMYIKQSKNVNAEGRVFTQYIKHWHHPRSTLMDLIIDLVNVFGQNPPLASFTTPSSNDRSEFIAKLPLANYMDPDRTKRDAVAIVDRFQDIRGSFQDQPFADGTRKPVLSLDGTIPVIYRDSVYNIPICVHLMDQHPHQAPIVFVKPTSNMVINDKNIHVDKTGLVKTPYIIDWKYPNFDLMGLLQDLTVTFGRVPPVLTDSKTKPAPGSQTMTGKYQSTSKDLLAFSNYVEGRSSEEVNIANTQSRKGFRLSGQGVAPSSGQVPAQSQRGSPQSGHGAPSSGQVPAQSQRGPPQSGQVPGRRASVDDYCLGSAEDDT